MTVSAIMVALALIGFSVSKNILTMCLLAIPLGLSSGATDAALNNYISLHYKAMHLNFMHCFYGVGIMTSPYLMSMILKNAGWREGYQAIFGIQMVIVAIIVITLPIWKKVGHKDGDSGEEEDVVSKNLSYLTMFKTSEIRLAWLMCIAINAIEGVMGTWGAFYLTRAHELSDAKAAGLITMFYIGLALGRFLSGLLSTKLSSWKLIKLSVVVMVAGTIVMFLPNPMLAATGFLLVGLGNGPVYPNIMHMTPKHFGKEYSASISGSQIAAAYFGVLVGPPIYAFLADKISASLMPACVLVWDALFIVAAVFFLNKMKKMNKSI